MPKKYLILISLILAITAQLSFADNVIVKSRQEGTVLPGILTIPQGDGPFPAVVLLHGCGGHKGSWPRTESWSKRLVGWGYVTLAVDSFEPRNMSNICTDMDQLNTMGITRAQDAYDAKDFLSKLPFVNR